ncbi:SusC/RagA family TonB-linked outer membrane protein [Rhodohalobacter sulfatireducens]|uniref:TonB-dependent receptor n=1 Tax=Rhodohalobacter sulfatireducens TaxID=2911366 RepID=A0ABS9KHW7_9BACT|nr:TonB-dependent receptor [Rhodohalobacter sulfatireducens]MCG2590449.1 TonB-dependent receptor [Rhodohalobacter sulfatireducens]
MIKEKRILLAILFIGLPLIVSAQIKQATPDLAQEWITEANTLNNTSAQVEALTGTVVDGESGEPLPGVNILLKGTSRGTSTNVDGEFELEVESLQDTLIVSFIGYQTMEVPVNGQSELTISLHPEAVLGEELVVVGYGTQRRENLTGSISTINSEEIDNVPVANLGQSLAGKATGLFVKENTGKPGSAPSINIRNFGNPLVIVDGVEQANFTSIDPSEVQSFSVLKDASAAIYGSKAGNGVILITTKKGRSNTPIVNYGSSLSVQRPTAYPEFLSTWDFARASNDITDYQREVRERNGEEYSYSAWNPIPGFDGPYSESDIQAMKNGALPNTNWVDVALNDWSPMQNHNINVSGRNEIIGYFVSGAYNKHQGMYQSGDASNDRYNIRSNVDVQVNEDLNIAMNLSLRNTDTRDTYVGTDQIWMSLRPSMPFYPASYPDPNRIPYSGWDANNVLNTTDASRSGYHRVQRQYFTGSLEASYEIPFVEGLAARAKAYYVGDNRDLKRWGTPYTTWRYDESTDTYFNPITQNQDYDLVDERYENRRITFQGMLEYENSFGSFGDHTVKLLGLYETIDFKSDQIEGNIKGFISPAVDQIFAGNSETQTLFGTAYEEGNVSYAGRLNYDYRGKYLFDATVRVDGSSRFAPGVRWGTFPSFGVGWRISEEDFFQDMTNLFDDLKIRASYSETGYDRNAAAYQYLTTYSFSGTHVFGGTPQTGLSPDGLVNTGITWETMNTYNAGLEFSILEGLFGMEVDYFYRLRDGILTTRETTLPNTFGASLPQENLNSIDNRGIEVVLNHFNQINDFSYSLSTNFSWTRAKYKDIEEQDFEDEDLRRLNELSGRWQNLRFGYETDGFLTEEDLNYESSGINYDQSSTPNSTLAPGMPKYVDQNGDGVIDWRDQVRIGKGATPEIAFGFTANANYKNFDMSMLWQGATGYDIALQDHMRYPVGGGQDGGNIPQFLFDGRWTPDNTNSRFPRLSDNNTYLGASSDMFLFSAGYVRLKNVTVGYSLPNSLLTRVRGISDLRVHLSGYNLLTFNKLSEFNIDPESGGNYNGRYYPQFKSFSIGIDLTIQ